MNYADWFRRTDRQLKSLSLERMIRVFPRIGIPGAPLTWIPESESDQARIYIPADGEEVELGERRPLTPYRESNAVEG
jgi:hypothetical protein